MTGSTLKLTKWWAGFQTTDLVKLKQRFMTKKWIVLNRVCVTVTQAVTLTYLNLVSDVVYDQSMVSESHQYIDRHFGENFAEKRWCHVIRSLKYLERKSSCFDNTIVILFIKIFHIKNGLLLCQTITSIGEVITPKAILVKLLISRIPCSIAFSIVNKIVIIDTKHQTSQDRQPQTACNFYDKLP